MDNLWHTVMQNDIHSCRKRSHLPQEMSDKKLFFTRCIHDNMDSLYSVALRLTKNNADAEDLVAEATARAWSAFDSLDDPTKFRPWIFRILHNCYISDYRKKAVRPAETCYAEHPADEEVSEIASLLMSQSNEFLHWWANPERAVINDILAEDMTAAIESLPELFRITVVLINIEGLSYDETAQVLGVSPGTVRSRMNRGRTLLQKALWQHARDAGLITDSCKLE